MGWRRGLEAAGLGLNCAQASFIARTAEVPKTLELFFQLADAIGRLGVRLFELRRGGLVGLGLHLAQNRKEVAESSAIPAYAHQQAGTERVGLKFSGYGQAMFKEIA